MAKINDCALIYKGKTSVTIYNKSLSCVVFNSASSARLNSEGSRTVLMSVLNLHKALILYYKTGFSVLCSGSSIAVLFVNSVASIFFSCKTKISLNSHN